MEQSNFALARVAKVLAPQKNDDVAQKLLQESSSLETSPHAGKRISYGTAGFREKIENAPMTKVMVRTAAFAVSRSISCGGAAVGVMVTASHNDESYNGVKIADPDGGMMPQSEEKTIESLANQENLQELWSWVSSQQKGDDPLIVPVLYVGRDTRVHSLSFRNGIVDMAVALGAQVMDLGVVTTPMLHHSVLHANAVRYLPKTLIPLRPMVGGYLDLLAYSYTSLVQTKEVSQADSMSSPLLLVDCACGVGFPGLVELVDKIQSLGVVGTKRIIQPTNAPGAGSLNQGCGSEHVQKGICPPKWYDTLVDSTDTRKDYCASFDGDADRIVFFAADSGGGDFCLLDGDKIACLLCEFLQEQLEVLNETVQGFPQLKLGVVQTAYANGASTHYLQKLLGPDAVCITKTGVKHLHSAAHKFDIGIYFEANGHGTILFGSDFYKAIDVAQQKVIFTKEGANERSAVALQRLSLLPSLVNQAVGDALSDLLLVDSILYLKNWTLRDWYSNQYTDYPSRQVKVKVADRTVIQTNHNETECLAPQQAQVELESAMKVIRDGPGGGGVARTFVRPSGTEDVVRVYAEASTRKEADELALQAVKIVYNLCGGVGELPEIN